MLKHGKLRLNREVEALFFEDLEELGAKFLVVNHSMVIWTKTDEIFGRVVFFVEVDVVKVDDFFEAANDTRFGDGAVGFEVDSGRTAMIVGFIFVLMK